jgi:polyketide synthase-associated protein
MTTGQEEAVVPCDEEVRWPEPDEDSTEFLQQIVKDLLEKDYCLINMPHLTATEKADLGQCVSDVKHWSLPKKEFEDGLLGRQNTTKYTTVPEPGPDSDASINLCDQHLTELLFLLAPITSTVFGFSSWGRLTGTLRVPFSTSAEEKELRPAPLQQSDYDDGRVFGHLNFLERRKLGFLYLLQNNGGTVELYGETTVKIPIAENILLVWRNDLKAFSYRPSPGNSIALQTWVLSEPWSESEGMEATLAELPEHMEQENRVSVTALHMHTAGSMNSTDDFWNGLMYSVDGQVRIPHERWDHDLYYSQDRSNTSNCKHGAFVDQDQLVLFAPKLFDMQEAEVADVSPAQRLVLTTGHRTLSLAGFDKASLRSRHIAHYLGDSQSDWINLASAKAATPNSYAGSVNTITAMRLSYVFGMRGPCQHIDTACSSSLVSLDRAHLAVKKATKDQYAPNIGFSKCEEALVTGLSLCLDPHLYIGYSGAGMLSRDGRCFTFDKNANGFARGEGCASTFLQSSEPEKGHPDMLVALVGSFTNQDGKSANLTAPNGPSQAAATRASLEESGFSSEDVSACECHGTGTPLGDPIELTALRGAFAKQPHSHPAPLPHSSAKTNIGHGEANAGLAGFTKCVMMVSGCTNPGNNHLRTFNPNLDLSGYPALIGDIAFDFGMGVNTGLMGVSSFGSGGTNARADIWGRCTRGANKTSGVTDNAELLRKREAFFDRVETFGQPGPQSGDQLSLVGTWNAWSDELPMEKTGNGEWVASIVLGETLSEQFHIVVNGDRAATIHPQVPRAGCSAQIAGPDGAGDGLHWRINGRVDQVPAGTAYTIKFQWSFDWERGESKILSWERSSSVEAPQMLGYEHEYYVKGTWTSWKLYRMDASTEEAGLYTVSTRIGALTGLEEFQIVRDKDESQVIYPARNNPIKTSVPVKGPDENGGGKHWVARGPPGFKLEIELRVQGGNIQVSQIIEKKGKKTWKSSSAEIWHDYYASGSWNNWSLSLMTPDFNSISVFRIRNVIIGEAGYEDFRIVVDKDADQVIYPLDGAVRGPDAGGGEHCFRIEGSQGDEFEIVLDTSGAPMVEWSRSLVS